MESELKEMEKASQKRMAYFVRRFVTLLMALLIYTGEYPALAERMREAKKRIQLEDLKVNSILCEETVKRLIRMKGKRK